MSFNKEEKAWLVKYENRLVNQGVPREEAIYIRNAVTDIDLNSSPEVCAEYEISKTLRRKR